MEEPQQEVIDFGLNNSDCNEDGQKNAALVSLESELAREKDERNEERFFWIVFSLLLIDILILRNASNDTLGVVMLSLQLIALFVLAKKLGIEAVTQFLTSIFKVTNSGGKD